MPFPNCWMKKASIWPVMEEQEMKVKLTAAKQIFSMVCGCMLAFCLTACSAGDDKQQGENFSGTELETQTTGAASTGAAGISSPSEESPAEQEAENGKKSKENETMKMNVQVGDSIFTAILEENTAAAAFVQLMKEAPVVIQMSDYSGFEKVGSLGTELPADNSRTTTQSGDIVLYNGNQIVIFYGSNAWSYTRLGKIEDLTGWEEALGSGDATVTFSVN